MTTLDAALRLPRHAWTDHPRYPTQTLLLGSHDSFRRTSSTLIARAESGGDLAGIQWVFSYWKSAMRGHEHYEEHKLYPYLEARFPLSCDALRAGHDHLAELDTAVRDAEDLPALAAALKAHDAVLCAHLEAEEALVIPALLALAPEEFETYYHSDIRTLLRTLEG